MRLFGIVLELMLMAIIVPFVIVLTLIDLCISRGEAS